MKMRSAMFPNIPVILVDTSKEREKSTQDASVIYYTTKPFPFLFYTGYAFEFNQKRIRETKPVLRGQC